MNSEDYLDALLNLPSIDDELIPEASPDGRWVAWTWFHTTPAADVFAVPTDGSQPPIRLTDTDQNTYFFSWTADSQSVIVGQDMDGDERIQLFKVHLAAPEAMFPLTEARPNYFIQDGILHPNGKWLFYGANRHPETGDETEESYIYRHDLKTGERLALAQQQKPSRIFLELNAAGTHLLYTRADLHPAGMQIWMVATDGSDDHELFNFGENRKVFAKWHPNGRQILLLAETNTHRKLGLWGFDTPSVRWLIDDPTRNIQYAYVPERCTEAVLLENVQGRVRSSLLDLETGAEVSIPMDSGNLIPLAPLSDGKWVGVFYDSAQPGEVVRFNLPLPSPSALSQRERGLFSPHRREMPDRAEGGFDSLTNVWSMTTLLPKQLHHAEDFIWRSVDGMQIHGWLYRAANQAKGTLVYVHGGPTYHVTCALNAEIQFFVEQGFNVFVPNYRGSTGYGLAFQFAILEDGWGGREQDDIRTGIEALIKAGIAEKGKVGMTGTSYGGYSSWWAITHFPKEIVAASVPICGMTDLVVDYETTRPDLRPYSEEMNGGRPDQVPGRYYERSPIHFVQNIEGKLLIVQGGQDPNVTPKNVDDVIKELHRHKIPYELLLFEDEGHGIYKEHNQRTLFLRMAEFFTEAFE